MLRPPDVSVIVTTYQRPHSLARVLASLAVQDFAGTMEVVVADDGSTDQTHHVVRRHQAAAPYDVRLVSHPHDGFQLARCRNEGVREARAPYLILLDGDCVAPPCHVTNHLRLGKPGMVLSGAAHYLDEAASEQLDEDVIRRGDWHDWAPQRAFRKLRRANRKARLYAALGHPTKPRLRGGNFGIWRADFLRVNGFDENFQGWGCEDDDLGLRLRRAGCSIRPAFDRLPTFHLWHPIEPSVPQCWKEGVNVDYLHRPIRWTRCVNGLKKREAFEMTYLVRGNRQQAALAASLLRPATPWPSDSCLAADIEVIVAPASARFSHRADCRVLIVPHNTNPTSHSLRTADVVLADRILACGPRAARFPLDDFPRFLEASITNPSAGSTRRPA